jgi:hypothetical protein
VLCEQIDGEGFHGGGPARRGELESRVAHFGRSTHEGERHSGNDTV